MKGNVTYPDQVNFFWNEYLSPLFLERLNTYVPRQGPQPHFQVTMSDNEGKVYVISGTYHPSVGWELIFKGLDLPMIQIQDPDLEQAFLKLHQEIADSRA